MQKLPNRFDTVSIVLHWSVGIAIIAVAAIELLRGEMFPRGSFIREALKALHNPAGTVVFGLILLRILWRLVHPAPAMPESMRPWEKVAAKLTHYVLYLMMVMIPLTGIVYVLARGQSIDFGLFQIVLPSRSGRRQKRVTSAEECPRASRAGRPCSGVRACGRGALASLCSKGRGADSYVADASWQSAR